MAKKAIAGNDPSTEEKIREAARKIFMQKGYAATRTRDIAEEAGINLALLNYYFRSKEKLFDIVMLETLQHFLLGLKGAINNKETSLEKKIEVIVSDYIDLLIAQPDLPIFVLSEIRNNPDKLLANMGIKEVLLQSVLVKQLQETIKDPDVHPLHFIMNMLGLTIFPFIARPMLQRLGNLKDPAFEKMILERKRTIPKWIKAMLKTV